MKKIFCAVLALAAMASCSKEYIVAEDKQAIGFGEVFVENSTRATDLTYTDTNKVTAFKVYGTVQGIHSGSTPVFIFNGDDVKNRNTDGTNTVGYDDVWFCNNIQYWVPNANYLFTAVVDGELDIVNNKIAYDVSSQKDLLLAATNASVDNDGNVTGLDNNDLVAFTFNHLLSKAYFTFKTNKAFQTEEYTYEISKIQFDNAYTEGTYSVSGVGVGTGTWDATGDDVLSFGIPVTLAPSKANVVTTTSELVKVFIPQSDVEISFTATIKYKGTPVSVKDYSFVVFKASEGKKSVAGHQYNFVAEFDENATIQFTVHDVTDWVVDTNGDGVIDTDITLQ